MTEELEVHIPYGDLTRVSFACDCGTEITIDISSEKIVNIFGKTEP